MIGRSRAAAAAAATAGSSSRCEAGQRLASPPPLTSPPGAAIKVVVANGPPQPAGAHCRQGGRGRAAQGRQKHCPGGVCAGFPRGGSCSALRRPAARRLTSARLCCGRPKRLLRRRRAGGHAAPRDRHRPKSAGGQLRGQARQAGAVAECLGQDHRRRREVAAVDGGPDEGAGLVPPRQKGAVHCGSGRVVGGGEERGAGACWRPEVLPPARPPAPPASSLRLRCATTYPQAR